MPPLNVLIVGASIAGPTTAYWLAKLGARITIIERYPSLRTGGQNIDIRTAGVTVMRRMPGMEAAVRAKTTTMDGMSFVREDGSPWGTIKPTGNAEQQSLVSEFEIFRGDLARILCDMTKKLEGVEYVFNEQVTAMETGEDVNGPLIVDFMNGRASETFDLVVACDGATSRTRAIGLGCGVRDHIIPTNCWAAYFSIKRDLLNGSKTANAITAPGGRFLAVGPDPSGRSRIGMMAMNAQDAPNGAEKFREAMKQGDDALKGFVARHYAGIGWKAKEILERMKDSDDFYGSETVTVKVPHLSKGRFVMVGDAGCAPSFTGGGTTLAMTGGYILAGELGKCNGDIAMGLQEYERVMKPIVEEMQKVPPGVKTIMAPQTAWGIWIRNHLFALVTSSGILEFGQKYLAGAFGSAEEYKLPAYKWTE